MHVLCLGELNSPGPEAHHFLQCWCQHAISQTPLTRVIMGQELLAFYSHLEQNTVSVTFFFMFLQHNNIFIVLSFPVTLDSHLSECSTQRKV